MEILRAVVKVGFSTLFNLLSMVLAGKVLATMLGPAGLGLYTILRQLQQNLVIAGTMNGNNALVQGIASNDGEDKLAYLTAVFWVLLPGIILIAGILFLGAPWIAPMLLGRSDPQAIRVVRWVAAPVFAGGIMNFFICVLNGYRDLNRLLLAQLSGAVAMMVAIYPLTLWIRSGRELGYAAVLFTPLFVTALVAAASCYAHGWIPMGMAHFRAATHKPHLRHFLKVAAPLMLTGVISTGAQLSINGMVAGRMGLTAAGYYSVAWSISMTYVTLLLNSYGTYYLPTLTASRDKEFKQKIMSDFLNTALLLLPPMIVFVVFAKPLMISLLFTPKFYPALKVMRWMMVGDFFKVLSWVLAIPMLAFVDMKSFILSELFFNILLVVANSFAIIVIGKIEWVGIIFLGNYILYFAYCVFYAYRFHDFRYTRSHLQMWLTGMILVGLATAWTWNAERISLVPAMIFISLSILLPIFGLTSEQRGKMVVFARAKLMKPGGLKGESDE